MTPHTTGPRALLATVFALLTMLASTAAPCTAQASPADPAHPTARPAGVPADYVATPNGWFSPQCVFTLKEDETVVQDQGGEFIAPLAQAPKGKEITGSNRPAVRPALQGCSRPHFDAQGRELANTPAPAGGQTLAGLSNGWMAKTDAATNYGLGYLSATWNVPGAPAVDSAQTIYYFPGLQNRSGPAGIILQPVLAWHQGTWTLASWHCCAVGNVFHSEPIAVTGSQVAGVTQGFGCNAATGACSNWVTLTKDVASGRSTTFADTVEGRKMDWAFSAALEVYGVSACEDLPVGPVTFSDVEVDDVNGLRRFLSWNTTPVGPTDPDCGYRTTATWNSSTVYQHN